LTLDGKVLSQKLRVKGDPRESWTAEQYAARHEFLAGLYAELSTIDTALNTIDGLRRQLHKRAPELSTAPLALRAQARSLAAEAGALKSDLTSNPQNGEDSILMADKLRERLLSVIFGLYGSFAPPLAPHYEQAAEVHALLEADVARYNILMRDVEALNHGLQATGRAPLAKSGG
jgi:hypothetical protein